MKPRKTRSRCSCGFDFTAEKNRHRRKCGDCGVPRIAKTRPKHAAALDLPYAVYLEANGGIDACGICGATKKPGGKALHRDHDHRASRPHPRGLLCFPCNSALRPYMTLEWVEAAARYLRRTAMTESLFDDFQKGWSAQPWLTLCDRMARKGLAVVAVNGECPVHGGDGCLYAYVQVAGLRRALTGE